MTPFNELQAMAGVVYVIDLIYRNGAFQTVHASRVDVDSTGFLLHGTNAYSLPLIWVSKDAIETMTVDVSPAA
jgi:lactam utilization protein B